MRFGVLVLGLVFWGTQISSGHAKCKINLTVKNTSKKNEVRVQNSYFSGSEVRVKRGTWKKLYKLRWVGKDFYVKPGATKSDVVEAKMKCSAQRRYMIRYACISKTHTGEKVVYYPSSTGYTTRQTLTINLTGCD